MKKLSLMFMLAVLLTACGGNDDEPAKVADLNVKALTTMIGQNFSYVKNHFTDGEGISETASLLMYNVKTPNGDYSVSFKGASAINQIVVYRLCDTYDTGIAAYRTEMDRINSTLTFEMYMGHYKSNTAGLIDFSNRSELWDYINENDVSSTVYETWWIENTADVKFTVEGVFNRSNNSITIEIERKEW